MYPLGQTSKGKREADESSIIYNNLEPWMGAIFEVGVCSKLPGSRLPIRIQQLLNRK